MNQLSESATPQVTADNTPTTDPHLEEIVNEKEALKQQVRTNNQYALYHAI